MICTHSLRVILSVRTSLGEPKIQFEGSLPLAATTNLDGNFLSFKKSPNKYIISCSLRRKDSSHCLFNSPKNSHLLRMTRKECEHRCNIQLPNKYKLIHYVCTHCVILSVCIKLGALNFNSKDLCRLRKQLT